MNKNAFSVLFVAVIIMLACISIAAAQEIKCVWEPCGTKVQQKDIDTVYALEPIKAMWAYHDADSDGKFDDNDVLYIDTVVDPDVTWSVEEGDVRLTNYHDIDSNTKVTSNDPDHGYVLKTLCGGQAVVGFYDKNNDGVFDKYDPLYVDTDCSSSVTVNDVRLTERTVGNKNYPSYSRVGPNDLDITNDLKDPVTYNTIITTDSRDLLGYIDSDCDNAWSCPDKLYLQQIRGDIGDRFVTIGDHRLYVPPDETGWPVCGTRVQQGDIDAVYVLTKDSQIQIMYGDVNSNRVYDQGETIYVDMVNNPRNEVEEGDIRLSKNHDNEPNTKVDSDDTDRTDPLEPLPGGQTVVGFVDVNSDGVYDKHDPLYVDTDNSSDVTAGDIRLTVRTAMEGLYPAYTMVEADDWDAILNEDLLDTAPPYVTNLVTPFWELVGYIDSDCSGDWTCPDKLYLQQLRRDIGDYLVTIGDHRLYIPPDEPNWPVCGTKVQQCDIDAVYVLTKDEGIRILYGDTNSDSSYNIGETVYVDMIANAYAVEEGDVRLTWYHDEFKPNTKVYSLDIDKNNPLKPLPGGQAVVGFVDVNGNGVYNKYDPLYVDTDGNSRVTTGDVRLTSRTLNGVTYNAYTVVEAGNWDLLGDTDLKDPVSYSTVLATPFWVLVGFIDSDCSGDWTCPDKLYLQQIKECPDISNEETADLMMCVANEVVTIGDLRLYIPPEESDGEDNPEEANPGEYHPYDVNEDCVMQMEEMMAAIGDWKHLLLSMEDMMETIGLWKELGYC